MRRILLSLLVIVSVAGATIKLSSAYFSDLETSSGNTFTAGIIDLKVNGDDNPVSIVSFADLKPGDQQTFPKTLKVIDNDAYVWMHIKEVVTGQGNSSEPENAEEAQLGFEKYDIDKFLTYTLNVGGDQIISTPIGFNDAVSCWIPLGEIQGNELINMSQVFNFDPNVTNWAQGDTMSFTEEFYAEQVANNPYPVGPTSLTGRIWNGTKCVDSLELLATVNVPANSSSPIVSSVTTEQGKTYKIKAIGTADAGDTITFDAKYSLTNRIEGDTWTDVVSGYESDGPNLLDLMINGNFVNWGTFNEDHIYWYETTGDGSTFSFQVNDTFPSNNSGMITVEIYKVN